MERDTRASLEDGHHHATLPGLNNIEVVMRMVLRRRMVVMRRMVRLRQRMMVRARLVCQRVVPQHHLRYVKNSKSRYLPA